MTRHGHSNSPTWNSWSAMWDRCTRQKHPKYHLYGGRGITVCDRWKRFDEFLEDMGVRPDGLTLDRIDRDGNYEPGNVRWATYTEQNRNKRTNRIIEINGRKLNLSAVAELIGISPISLRSRLEAGWTIERAISAPINRNLSCRHRGVGDSA